MYRARHFLRTYCCMAIAVLMLTSCRPEAVETVDHTHLVIVVDGLRPDYVTPELMPRLSELGRRGVVFNAHRAVFPTVTRVNAPSFVTGAYPETHGLTGNSVYLPAVDPARTLDTGSREDLELIDREAGPLLSAPTLGELLEATGRRFVSVSSGSPGSAFLLNYRVGDGANVHTEYTLPPELHARALERLGPAPEPAMPNVARNRRAVDAYLVLALEEIRPDVTFMWLNDPDGTAHATGIGSGLTREALAHVDEEIGRIEDTLRSMGLLERTNLLVTSDHGFSTHTGEFNLGRLVAPFVRTLEDGSDDVITAGGAVHLRREAAGSAAAPAHGAPYSDEDLALLQEIVAELQRRLEVGAVFTRPRPGGGPEGIIPGTLSFDVARWNHERSGDVLVSANWSHDVNEAGFAGTTTLGGVAGHGTSSPYDVHNTLIAAGPDFREGFVSDVPTGNVDIAPTLLHLLGLQIPGTMTGRVIEEAFHGGPEPTELPVERVTETVRTPDGAYELTAHVSIVAGRRYLDYTEVRRSQP